MTAGGVEVELVEDAPVERPSSPKRLLIVLAAVLALTSVAWVVSARVQAAERAALLAERGFAPSLADPVVAAWEAPTFGPLLDDGSRLVGTAGETLIAVDLVTGEVAWSLDPRGSCQPVVDGEAARDVWPVSAAGAEALLWCQVRAGQPTDLVLDPADGSTVARVQTPGRPLVATVQEGDVVRLHDLGGQLTWQRWSLTGALRWSGGTTDAVLDTAWGTASIEAGGAYATVTGTRTVVVDLATGREVDPAMVVIGGTVDRRGGRRPPGPAGGGPGQGGGRPRAPAPGRGGRNGAGAPGRGGRRGGSGVVGELRGPSAAAARRRLGPLAGARAQRRRPDRARRRDR